MTVKHPKMVRAGEALAWTGAVAVLVALVAARFVTAVSSPHGPDFDIFTDAANAVLDGHTPWAAQGYVYPPLVALALIPIVMSPAPFAVWTGLSLLAAVIAIAAFCATVFSALPHPWMRPTLVVLCTVTLLYSWPAMGELFWGQTNFFVLAFLALAGLANAHRRAFSSGAAVALAGLVKTWPAAAAVWFGRRPSNEPGDSWRQRGRSLAAMAVTVATAPLVTLLLWGPAGLREWIATTLRYSAQELTTWSVWGFPRNVFGDLGDFPPVADSPLLGSLALALLGGAVVALLGVALLRPGQSTASLWNVVACVVLLLPVSQLNYRILMLPVMWFWAVDFLRRTRRRVSDYLTVTTFAAWWLLVFRVLWPSSASGLSYFLAVMAATFAVIATSVVRAARLADTIADVSASGDEPR